MSQLGTHPPRPLVGASLLTVASLLWGMGFYAQRMSIGVLAPLTATAYRFALTLPFVLAALVLVWRRGVRIPFAQGSLIGAILYVGFAMQTAAMAYTSVTRVALLNALYAVFTPLLQPLFGLGRPTPTQLAAAGMACLGTGLLCVTSDGALGLDLNLGDALAIGMALLSALAVQLVGRIAQREDPIALNAIQIAVMALLALLVAPLFESAPALTSLPASTWWSLAYLALFSTMAAFVLQFLGQRHLSPTPATTIMLLETPIGVVAAVLLLGESMTPAQWTGAGFALVAVVLAVQGERSAVRARLAPATITV